MRKENGKLRLLNIYWLIHIVFYFFMFFEQKSQNSIYAATYLIIPFLLTITNRNNLANLIGSILQILYAIFFLYETVFRSLISESDIIFYITIIAILNTLNFIIPILIIYHISKPNVHINRKRIIRISLSLLIVFFTLWSFDSFYLKEIETRKNISRGKIIIEKISEFRLKHNRLPFSLGELDISHETIESFTYELDTIAKYYYLRCTFEHWFNRQNREKGSEVRVMTCEMVEYDSRNKKWTHN